MSNMLWSSEEELKKLSPSKKYMVFKYFFDVFLILISLPIVLPIAIVVAILIKLDDGGPVFYTQDRVGYLNVPFKMYKFRTMTKNSSSGVTVHQDNRITKIGAVLRKNRIDEIPQFWNVLKGQMSLIGPRAEYKKFAEELEKDIPEFKYRHIVKPGISGWAQVMHGYATGVDDTKIKLEYDFYYIKNFSLWLDILIVFKTLKTMLTGFGAR